jgi:TrmH family RNA methyltransferase
MPSEPSPVQSRSHPLVRRLRALRATARAGDGCLLEGPKLLIEALAAGVSVREAAVSSRAGRTAAGREALSALAAAGVVPRRLDEDLLQSLSEAETSQGVLAIAERPRFEEARLFAGTPLVLFAIDVQNPGNLGGLLRTAEAAGATGALLAGGTADPLAWKALRGSMGSAFRLPHVRERVVAAALERLEARGVRLAAAVARGGTRYDAADLRGPTALLVGNESAGLDPAVEARASLRLTVPLAPPVESLNVGVAAALLLFEAARQRAATGGQGTQA